MRQILHSIGKQDWILVGSAIGLTAFGIFSLFSSSVARGSFSNVEKQLLFLGLGFALMLFFSFFDYRLLRNNSYAILALYGFGVLALAGLLFFAPEIRGIKGWYRIGGISIDPIEFMKLILLILMAKYFSARHIEVYRIRHIFFTGLYLFIPMALIVLQPDLGPVIILLFLWGSLLLVAGIRLRHLFGITATGIAFFAASWNFLLLEHQKNRIISFIAPELDPTGIGWSQLQSKIAIGNGGILGQGFASGTQTQYGFLSEPQTDFIFAAIAEEFGFLGICLLFLLLGIFVWRIVKIGATRQDNFSRLYAAGFAALIISQVFINVGMNLGLLPIIGLSFPLVSYGGSSLVLTYIGLGILLSMRSR